MKAAPSRRCNGRPADVVVIEWTLNEGSAEQALQLASVRAAEIVHDPQ